MSSNPYASEVSVKVFRQTEDYTTASSGPLMVQLWHNATTLTGVDSLAAASAHQLRAHKAIYFLHVTMTTKAPEGPARERITQLTETYGDRTSASALVFEGTGFGAATVRAAVAGISMLARHPFPYRVFAYVHAALEWFESVSREPALKAALETAQVDIIELRQRHLEQFKRAG